MNKRKITLLLNILIIIFESIGFIIIITNKGRIGIEYYTEDSNIIAFLTSIVFVIYLLLNKKIPYYLKMLKYISTICLTVTLLVVIFILAPMYNFNYVFFLFKNDLLYHHLLCPILCIISFTLFEDIDNYTIKDNIIATSTTLLYGIILIILNLIKVVEGPYPFLKVYIQPIYITIIWIISILIITYIIALVLRIITNKKRKCEKNDRNFNLNVNI